ncbi:16S rRNA (guanine1207-N2)-methyltransferase [Amaricoccus macauensis]|uniref:16S rRNA (Guanine1207-N2)-methyltransferase n=1 Tax=Amaricoccus macauensis TaxID=57001 RepID=A0A840SLA4_9RHOB|nr:methyltransferase [Amaricoccus macauensis]MBB5220948.1 16S rRNA (guanine1207-N2)-methyltransferase [Amaricoccus macauensis]
MTNRDRLALAVESGSLVLPDGDLVVLRAEPGLFLDLVPDAICEQAFRPTFDTLARANRRVEARLPDGTRAAAVVVNLSRSRAENLGAIARGLGMLADGGRLVIAGSKADGVDSLTRQVGNALPADGSFVKSHGRVVWLDRPALLPDAVAEWSAAAQPRPNDDGFLTAPGMFSPEHADPGSRRLAAELPGRLSGRVADLGAGWGWLAAQALSSNPGVTELDLYEADALALDAARANVRDPRARFHWSDATSLAAGTTRYDAVIANPPFHHGRAAEPDIGAAFIAAAARILKPSGTLHLVANRQLPYEAPLAAAFRQVEKIGESGIYKVIRADRPASPRSASGRSARP